jgi:hypothetical protein
MDLMKAYGILQQNACFSKSDKSLRLTPEAVSGTFGLFVVQPVYRILQLTEIIDDNKGIIALEAQQPGFTDHAIVTAFIYHYGHIITRTQVHHDLRKKLYLDPGFFLIAELSDLSQVKQPLFDLILFGIFKRHQKARSELTGLHNTATLQ